MIDLVDDLPPRLRAPLKQVVSVTATSLWVAPLVTAVLAAALALALIRFDPGRGTIPLVLADAEAARAAMTSIIGATIAATSLVITGTIIALQLATGQYSPRLLRGVLTDRGIRWSFGALVGVVVYMLVLLSQTGGERLPRAGAAIALLLGVGVVALLVYFTNHIIKRLRLETIVGDVTSRTLACIEATHPRDHHELDDGHVPDDAVSVAAQRSGYVQAASLDALVDAAARHAVNLRLRPRVGDFLVAGTTAAWAWAVDGAEDHRSDAPDGRHRPTGEDAQDLARRVNRALALGVDRTLDGDPAYGLRHLVDIGLRGVSTGVNDPTTAVQTIHHATRVLVALASRPLTHGVASRDGCRAVLPKPDLAAHFELAQSQLLQYGGGDARVVEALAAQLRDVQEGGTRPERTALVRHHLQRLRVDVERRDHHPDDRELLATALDRVERLLDHDTPDDEDSSAG